MSHKDHPGAFPEEQEARGLGTDLLGYGPEAAAKRDQSWRQDGQNRRAARAESKQLAAHRSEPIELSPSEAAELEGVRIDVMKYFRR